MSSKSLQEVLKKVSSQGINIESLRSKANAHETAYSIDYEDIAKEIKKQIFVFYQMKKTPKREKVIEDAAKKYAESLVTAFRTNKFLNPSDKNPTKYSFIKSSIEVFPTGPGKYLVVVSGSKDNFRTFKDRKRPYARILEKEITKGFGLTEENSPFINKGTGEFGPTGREIRKGGLLDLGHFGASEINTNISNLLFSDVQDEILRLASRDVVVKQTLEKIGFTNSPEFLYTIREESLGDNRTRGGLAEARSREIASVINSIAWDNVQASPSARSEIKRLILETAKTGKPNKKKSNKTVKKETKIPITRSKVKVKAPRASGDITQTENSFSDWSSLIPILNARMKGAVISQMGSSSLVNRTGTFAGSARIIDVTITNKGFPSFGMSYEKTPYGVFDRSLGTLPWAQPQRDPYTIIERALRSILTEFAIGRFYARRT